MKPLLIGIISFGVLVLGCKLPLLTAGNLEERVEKLPAPARTNVHMTDLAPFSWDYVIVNPPYGNLVRELVVRSVSFRTNEIPKLFMDESSVFFAFVENNAVVESFGMRRSHVDFGRLSTKVIYRTNDLIRFVLDDYPTFTVLRAEKVD